MFKVPRCCLCRRHGTMTLDAQFLGVSIQLHVIAALHVLPDAGLQAQAQGALPCTAQTACVGALRPQSSTCIQLHHVFRPDRLVQHHRM